MRGERFQKYVKRVLLALELNVETTLVGNAVLPRRSRLVDVQIPGVLHALVSRAKQYSRRSVDRCSTNSMRTILLSSEIEMQYFRYKSIVKLHKKKMLGSLCGMQIPLD